MGTRHEGPQTSPTTLLSWPDKGGARARAERRPAEARLRLAQRAAAQARRLQQDQISDRVIEVLPELRGLLPDAGLRPGLTYAVSGSTALLSALLAAPTSDGLWAAVVGMPGFSTEAAASLGCDLDRLVLVPYPGRDWVNVVAALVDALSVVVVRPAGKVLDAEAARLSARQRQHESVLIATGAWPRVETRLTISSSRWDGLGPGHGHLSARQVEITAGGRRGRSSAELWLPDRAGQVRWVEPWEGARPAGHSNGHSGVTELVDVAG